MESIINNETIPLIKEEKPKPFVYSSSTTKLPDEQKNIEHKKTEPEDNIKKSRAIKQGKLNEYKINKEINKIKQSFVIPETFNKTNRIVKNKIFIINKKKQYKTITKRNRSIHVSKNPLSMSNSFENNNPENKVVITEYNIHRKTNSKEPKTPNSEENKISFLDISIPKLKKEIKNNLNNKVTDSPTVEDDYLTKKNFVEIKTEEKMPLDSIRHNKKIKKENDEKKENNNCGKIEDQNSKSELFSKTFSKLQTNSIKFLDKTSFNTMNKINKEKTDNDIKEIKEETYNNNYIYDIKSSINNDKNESQTTNTKLNEENNEQSNLEYIITENEESNLNIKEEENDNITKIDDNKEQNVENKEEEKSEVNNTVSTNTKENYISEEIIDNKNEQKNELLNNKNENNEKLEEDNKQTVIKSQENKLKNNENKIEEEISEIKETSNLKEKENPGQQEIIKENEKINENIPINQDKKIIIEENVNESNEIKENSLDKYIVSNKITDSNVEDKENINDSNNSDSIIKNDEINVIIHDKELNVIKINNFTNNNQETINPILKQNESNNILLKKNNVTKNNNNNDNNKQIPKSDNNKSKVISRKVKIKSNKNLNVQKLNNSIKIIQKDSIISQKGNRTKRTIRYNKKNYSLKRNQKNTEKKSTSCNSFNLKNIIYKDIKSSDMKISNMGRVDNYNKESLKSHSESEIDNDDDFEVKDEFDVSEKRNPSSNEIINKLSSHILTTSKKNENNMLKSAAFLKKKYGNKENESYYFTLSNRENIREKRENRRTSGENKMGGNTLREIPVPEYNLNLVNQINRNEIEIQKINTKIKEIKNRMKIYDSDIREYDNWIEKEESEGILLRNLINFLTQKSK